VSEIEIRFRMNLKTGKKDIVIDFHGDEELMRHEHEKKHREIVQRLVGEGILSADEVGEIVVERAAPQQAEANRDSGGEQREAQGQGQ
tara:strand:- start:150 stop:413 length:264 start_codon:yes stop_codon:yes gene_type:complete